MREKQVQMFTIYSMSILLVIAFFSLTIFYSVSYSEERRIEKALINNQMSLLEKIGSGKTTQEITNYIIENELDVVFWSAKDPLVAQPLTQIKFAPQRPVRYDVLEKFYTIVKTPPFQNMERRTLVYSMATVVEFNGEQFVIQLVYNSIETEQMLENLSSVLFLGTGIVSFLGIGFGILLAYLNMMPVVKAWKQQRAFVADASHELRTPLSIITLKSDHLLSNSKDVIYDHIEDVAVIHQECRRMHKMVEDLLFLAKRDSGVVDINIADFEAGNLAKDLQQLYTEFFVMADKELVIDATYTGLVSGDFEKIKQVCMIIIDNALRFTKEGDYVKCSIELRGNRVLFTISNNGVPLEPKEIPLIFNRFYKSDDSRNRDNEKGGNGLGLSIAQEIMHLHQSKIRAQIVDGTTQFTFSLHKGGQKNNK